MTAETASLEMRHSPQKIPNLPPPAPESAPERTKGAGYS